MQFGAGQAQQPPQLSMDILWVTGSFKVNTDLPEEVLVLGGIFFLGEFPPLTVQSSSRTDIFILLQIKGSGPY